MFHRKDAATLARASHSAAHACSQQPPSPFRLIAQRTRVHFNQQHWLLRHMGQYYFEFEFGSRWALTWELELGSGKALGLSRL